MFSPPFVILTFALACEALTIPFNQVQNTGPYLQGLPDADRQRATLLKSVGISGTSTIPATNLAFVQYTISVGLGSPATHYELVVDSGSSNTFVGAGKSYARTKTSISSGQNVNVTYGTGFFSGEEFFDEVTLASNFVIKNQSIGDALSSSGFPGVDGIIGIGPVALTRGTLSPNSNAVIPTVADNAVAQGLISTEVIGIGFAPASSNDSTNGAITFGGADPSFFTGEVNFVPITSTFPSSEFFGLNATSATYGTTSVISQSTAGIVDTGTTLILLADDLFATYQAGIPGSFVDDTTGLIVIPPSQIASIKPFNFTIGGTVYALDANAQFIPQNENADWGGVPGVQYGCLGPSGSPSGEGLDFTLGQFFMERYYAVLDTANQRIGFAFTSNTFGP